MLSDVKSYELHIEQHHSMDGYRVKIRPVRTTDRTKAQIVQTMEKGPLASFLVEADEQPKTQACNPRPAPAAYCAPGGQGCLWENNGFEICGPCARRRSVCGDLAPKEVLG